MTREDAKDMLFDAHAEAGVVDAIYDDFESRICDNCKWFDKWEQCSNEDSPCNHVSFSMDKDFGCNKWERK